MFNGTNCRVEIDEMSEIIAKSKDIFRFVKTERIDPDKKELPVRQTEFVEIYNPFEAEEAETQSDRCLECGNPYCE